MLVSTKNWKDKFVVGEVYEVVAVDWNMDSQLWEAVLEKK